MKKRSLKIISSGFSYGAIVGMLLFIVNTPADSVLPQTLKILLIAAICGVVSGIFFTVVLFLLEIFNAKTYAPFRQQLASEGDIVLEDFAKRLVSDRLVRGWLFLTPAALTFCDSKKEMHRIPAEEIDSVQITDPKRNQITVTMTTSQTEVLLVSDALSWFNAIGDLQK